jgi:hypothetical protein
MGLTGTELNRGRKTLGSSPLGFRGVVRFEVITAVTMKNVVFWDVTPRDSC